MSGILIFIGFIVLICIIIKEETAKPIPKGTDLTQVIIDSSHVSKKELNRRINSGYYVKKEDKK